MSAVLTGPEIVERIRAAGANLGGLMPEAVARKIALGMLDAIREPSEAMEYKGDDAIRSSFECECHPSKIWRAMIDALRQEIGEMETSESDLSAPRGPSGPRGIIGEPHSTMQGWLDGKLPGKQPDGSWVEPDRMSEASADVKSVFIFGNGNVAVFNGAGEQIPELQGQNTPELREIIRARMLPDAEWLEQ